MLKSCFKCLAVLPETEFYAHPHMGDGHLGKCKACTKKDVREHYWRTRPDRQAYEKRRRLEPRRATLLRAYKKRYRDKKRAEAGL